MPGMEMILQRFFGEKNPCHRDQALWGLCLLSRGSGGKEFTAPECPRRCSLAAWLRGTHR